MGKLIVRLKEELTSDIERLLVNFNINIKHKDTVLKDLIIVEAKENVDFNQFSFIKSYKKTRVGSLLDVPKSSSKSGLLKVIPSPSIDVQVLRERGLYGLGNHVAIIDSGSDPILCGEVESSINFTDSSNSVDECGHGSIVTALIKHVAPAVKIHSLKVCEVDDDIDEEDVFRALDWIVKRLPQVKIINLSLGMDANCMGDCDLAEKIDAMSNQGYIIIAAMGNKASRSAHCPACADTAISVGALNNKGNKVANFSSKGHINSTKPNLVAPGCGQTVIEGKKDNYQGTSFSAPIITGIIGTIHNTKEMGSLSVIEKLISSCETLIDEPVSKQGAGKVDLQKL